MPRDRDSRAPDGSLAMTTEQKELAALRAENAQLREAQ